MHGKYLYEYAVIRIVPKVEREEFLNIGVVLFCKQARFIEVRYHIDQNKLSLFGKEIDIEQVEKNLKAFHEICCGSKSGGPIAQMDIASRFRWLTATRSSMIQTSKTHPGFSDDLVETLECLFEDLVL